MLSYEIEAFFLYYLIEPKVRFKYVAQSYLSVVFVATGNIPLSLWDKVS